MRKVLFGVFHDDVKKVHVREAAAAALEQLEQIRMCELGSTAPKRELQIGGYSFWNQLNHRFGRLRASELREENGGFAGAAKIALEGKRVVDDLAFVLFPRKTHVTPQAGECSPPVNADTRIPAGRTSRERDGVLDGLVAET